MDSPQTGRLDHHDWDCDHGHDNYICKDNFQFDREKKLKDEGLGGLQGVLGQIKPSEFQVKIMIRLVIMMMMMRRRRKKLLLMILTVHPADVDVVGVVVAVVVAVGDDVYLFTGHSAGPACPFFLG